MKKYFISSDIHSFYDEWMTALEEKGFDIDNKDHFIITCGDLFDRGPKSKECLDFVTKLFKLDRIICIRGNHEDLMEQVFDRGSFDYHDLHNMTNLTFCQLTTLDPKDAIDWDIIDDVRANGDLRYYLMKCKDFYETDKYVFVHGWIPTHIAYGMVADRMYPEVNWREGDWSNARWLNGMKAWNENVRVKDKTIVCGHWNSSWGHCHLHHDGREFVDEIGTFYIDPKTGKQEPHANYDTFKDEGIMALDACTVISHKVNVEVLSKGMKEWKNQ